MSLVSTPVLAVLTIAVSLGFVAVGVNVVRTRRGIGVRALGAFATVWGVNFVLNSTVVLVLDAHGIASGVDLRAISVSQTAELFLLVTTPLAGLLTVVAIFAWLWFVLSYTTRMDRNDELAILLAAIGVFLVTAANGTVGALSSLGHLMLDPGLQSDFHQFAGLIEILGTGVGIGAGAALLYRASQRHRLFALGAGVSLLLPVLLPYLVRYVYQFGLVVEFRAIGMLRLVSLSVGLAGLWAAVYRYDVLDQLPASQAVGRDTAFETTETAIVVLDDEDRISDLNSAAGELFDVSLAAALGEPVATILPETVDPDAVTATGRTTFRFPNTDRIVESETTATTDDRGRAIGRTIVFTDITDERRRQQRIQVLNRVLRHNLRNDLTVAAGYVDVVADGGPAADDYAQEVHEILDDLIGIGDKARDVEELLAAEPTVDSPQALSELVDSAVDGVSGRNDAETTVDVPDDVRVLTNPELLGRVLEELVENAVEHGSTSHTDDDTSADVVENSSTCRADDDTSADVVEHADPSEVCISFDGDGPAVVISDPGPGIPDHEIEVFESESETPLEHGSGLGLWVVKWGVDRFGGEVDFDTDDDGTRIAVTFPEEQLV